MTKYRHIPTGYILIPTSPIEDAFEYQAWNGTDVLQFMISATKQYIEAHPDEFELVEEESPEFTATDVMDAFHFAIIAMDQQAYTDWTPKDLLNTWLKQRNNGSQTEPIYAKYEINEQATTADQGKEESKCPFPPYGIHGEIRQDESGRKWRFAAITITFGEWVRIP